MNFDQMEMVYDFLTQLSYAIDYQTLPKFSEAQKQQLDSLRSDVCADLSNRWDAMAPDERFMHPDSMFAGMEV